MSAGLVKSVGAESGTIDVRDPATGATLPQVPATLATGGVYSMFVIRDAQGAHKATISHDAQFNAGPSPLGPSPLGLPLIERLISGR